MSQVFLGDCGVVQLQRTVDESGFIALVVPDDVNNDRNRFSYDYVANLGDALSIPDPNFGNQIEMQYVPLISGDRVRFQRVEQNADKEWVPSTDDQNLLVGAPGTPDNDFVAYVNVDGMGGIRFYDNFADAFNNNEPNSLELWPQNSMPAQQHFRVIAGQSDAYRGIAGITSYQFTTSREAIDVTNIGQNFRRFYSNGLISGQGTLDCFWLLDEICGDGCAPQQLEQCESARYLAELILRLEEGAVFSAKFILRNNGELPTDDARSVFYDCDKCVLTSVAVTVEPTQMVRARIEFITSGPFSLRYQYLPGFLLLEGLGRDSNNRMLQENKDPIEILDDD